MWDELIAINVEQYYEPACMKDGISIYPYTIAVTHYGHGIAYAVLGQIEQAKESYKHYIDAIQHIPSDCVRHNNKCSELVKIGVAMLLGELAYREGNYSVGFQQLHIAVELSDMLVYDEPWGWMVPPRHALGALYLEQGHVEGAIMQFTKDMDRHGMVGRAHPDNIWALGGLYRCYSKLLECDETGIGTGSGSGVDAGTGTNSINTSIYPMVKRDRHDILNDMKLIWSKLVAMDGATVACMCATVDRRVDLLPPPGSIDIITNTGSGSGSCSGIGSIVDSTSGTGGCCKK